MKLRILVQPQQGASYDALLAVAQVAEEEGFDGFFSADHYLRIGGGDGLPGPIDAWTTLAGLARDTTRIRLGTLVTSATFRLPGPLAITVAQVDAMSGGRVELGLGAGWFLDEHRAYGIPFPPTGERFDRLEEELAIITGLWRTPVGERFEFAGQHYQLEHSPALPKPVQHPHPPVIIGGRGKRRTPALAARFADEYNIPFLSPADAGAQYALVDQACEDAGRDPSSLRHSTMVSVWCGSDAAEVQHRVAATRPDLETPAVSRVVGTPDQVAAQLREWGGVGTTTMYIQILDLSDLDHLRVIGREVRPRL